MNRNLSRREFLLTTAVAATALASKADFTRTFNLTPIVVFTKVYQPLNLSFDESAALTSEAGLNGIDCPVRPGGEILPEKVADDLPRYAEAMSKRNLKIHLLTTAITNAKAPNAENILRAAKKVGVKHYRLGFFDAKADVPMEKQVAEIQAQFKDLAAMNKELGMTALMQNHSPAGNSRYVGGNLPELYEVVSAFNPDQIGVAFDIGHALLVHGNEWRPHFDKLKKHVKIAYVKDSKRGARFVPFGEGDIGGSGYFKVLKEMNYQAPISMHIEYDWSKGAAKTRADLLAAMRKDLGVLKRWIAEA